MTGFLLLVCGFAYFVAGRFTDKTAGQASVGTDFADEASFSWEGVLYSLDKMAQLRFLPREDKIRVLPLLNSPDEKVARAAAALAGKWARGEEDPAEGRVFFEALLKAAASDGGLARREAAIQAGLAAAAGFPFTSYAAEMNLAAAGLAVSDDPDTRAAGSFLAAAARGALGPRRRGDQEIKKEP